MRACLPNWYFVVSTSTFKTQKKPFAVQVSRLSAGDGAALHSTLRARLVADCAGSHLSLVCFLQTFDMFSQPVLCTLLETCGRFLYNTKGTSARMHEALVIVMRKKVTCLVDADDRSLDALVAQARFPDNFTVSNLLFCFCYHPNRHRRVAVDAGRERRAVLSAAARRRASPARAAAAARSLRAHVDPRSALGVDSAPHAGATGRRVVDESSPTCVAGAAARSAAAGAGDASRAAAHAARRPQGARALSLGSTTIVSSIVFPPQDAIHDDRRARVARLGSLATPAGARRHARRHAD